MYYLLGKVVEYDTVLTRFDFCEHQFYVRVDIDH